MVPFELWPYYFDHQVDHCDDEGGQKISQYLENGFLGYKLQWVLKSNPQEESLVNNERYVGLIFSLLNSENTHYYTKNPVNHKENKRIRRMQAYMIS